MSIYLTPVESDGFNCETCGPSFASARIEYDGDSRKWEFRGDWGCYSGDHFDGSRAEMIGWLRDEFTPQWGHVFTRASIKGAIEALREA